MLLASIAIVVGFILLVWGADRFIVGAASLARQLGAPPLLIGLTLVGLGTSAPEMVVAGAASLNGNPGLAIGNAIGSNITNIALILGATALIAPLSVKSGILRRELPVTIAVGMLAVLLCLDSELTRFDGGVLLTGLLALLGWLAWTATHSTEPDVLVDEFNEEVPAEISTRAAVGWLIAGMIILPLSSQLAVWGAVEIATSMGISDLVIGLTVVALGTSLPELAASLSAALKGEPDLALGNVLGSNMFNLLIVLAMPAIIAPGALPAGVLVRDLPVMMVLTVMLLLLCRPMGSERQGHINRAEGCFLLAAFVVYELLLYTSSVA